MENYVGIDLGAINSVICTFDKYTQTACVWKSPEQNDLTPSAIYIDRSGNEYVGQKAYNAAPRSPDNCTTLFKRFMGTSTPIELSAVNLTLTPEECSAKVLKTLFGYLPDEIRNSPYTGTVITVPAVFNQLQKNATIKAAEMAGIGNVELVQEPMAVAMSYMNARGGTDGIYLVYNLGRGILDIAIVESTRKRVNILAHDGIQMCGGRDFDRTLVDNIVLPWLHENFALPDNLPVNPKYKQSLRLAAWATERARLELSVKDEVMISLSEVEMCTNDLKGDEIYLEIPLHQHTYNRLIEDQINETIDAAGETLSKSGYAPNDVECIVWFGEATQYKSLRDKVSIELGIKGSTLDVNPITACAEGASIFAKSICWEDENGQGLRSKEIDLDLRRDKIFKSNSCKDLLHNPFYNLNATPRDNKHRILELSEERSLLSDLKTCKESRSILTIPTKRISAEVAWLPGIPPERANDILVLLKSTAGRDFRNENLQHDSLADVLSGLPYTTISTVADQVLNSILDPTKSPLDDGHPIEIDYFEKVSEFLGFDKLSPIARANLLAARMMRLHEYAPDIVPEWIIAIAHAFDNIDPSKVRTILNVERQESGFPEILDYSDIETTIQDIRHYYRLVIKFALECIYSIQERAQAVMTVVDSVTSKDSAKLPILIEDAIDSYEDGVVTLLELVEKKIDKHDQMLRLAAEEDQHKVTFARIVGEYITIVKDWGKIVQPIILKRNRQGLPHPPTKKISKRVKSLAIFLYNEYDKLESSLLILIALKEVFADIPEIDELATSALETLNRIAEQPESNNQISLFDY